MRTTFPGPRGLLAVCAAALALAGAASATPTTTYWAPSTTAVQPHLVPHVTYDTSFWRGAAAGQPGSPLGPIDTGLTMGVLAWRAVDLEVGFDLLLPSHVLLQRRIDLLTGPVWFFDGALKPGGRTSCGRFRSTWTCPGSGPVSDGRRARRSRA